MGKREVTIQKVKEWAQKRGLSRFERLPERRVLSEGADEMYVELRKHCGQWTLPFEAVDSRTTPRQDYELEDLKEKIMVSLDEKAPEVMELVEFRLSDRIERIRHSEKGQVWDALEASMLLHSTNKKFWVLISRVR